MNQVAEQHYHPFEIGTYVKLNSGGPAMKVFGYRTPGLVIVRYGVETNIPNVYKMESFGFPIECVTQTAKP